ncbi:MAG: hypothetical protein EXR77_09850 [Myxococcales bacterium]|nr:hypothetical protein [Myxococcales bacterium]
MRPITPKVSILITRIASANRKALANGAIHSLPILRSTLDRSRESAAQQTRAWRPTQQARDRRSGTWCRTWAIEYSWAVASTKAARGLIWQLAVVAGMLLSAPMSQAEAAPATLPEVLLIVDGSASMQHRVYANSAPICGTINDQRSRWVSAREIISGTFLGYKCANVTLPRTSEELVPPVPPVGAQKCIAGLPMVIGTNSTTTFTSITSFTVGGAAQSALLTYAEGLTGTTFQFPTVRLTFSTMPAPAPDWPEGTLSMRVRQVLTVPAKAPSVVLTLVDVNPTTSIANYRCNAAGPTRVVVSNPVTISPLAANSIISFTLTAAGMAALVARKKAGQVNAWLSVVPAAGTFPTTCLAGSAAITPNTGNFNFYGGAFVPQPTLTITNGSKCPAEGPTTHATASGVNDLGVYVNTPFGRDGLLDIFGPSAKFALLQSDTVLNQGTTAAAGFSFGASLTTYWGTANHGMASPFIAGSSSVPITVLDSLAARTATYNAINTALQNYVPNGPSTLGAQMEDALQYLGPGSFMDPHFKTLAQDPVNGDPFAACRTKLVVVLSDGGANFHDGTLTGRELALTVATKLTAANVRVHVVAVGHPAGAGNGPASADLQFLNDLAAAGGTTKAIVQSTPTEVVKALASAIGSTNVDSQANTRPVVSLATGAIGDIRHTFQALSAFNLSQPLRSAGVLEQRIFSCDGSCKDPAEPTRAQACTVVDFGSRLLSRSPARRLYTHKSSTRLGINNSNILPADLGIGTVGAQPKLVLNGIGDCTTSGSYDLAVVTQRNLYRDDVLNLLVGAKNSCRQAAPLGAASKSQPAVLEPADRLAIRDTTFKNYSEASVPTLANYSVLNPPGSKGRPTMLFTATHDGLLHAFRTDRNPKIVIKDALTNGDEMWAWLPKFTLGRLASLKLISTAEASYLGGSVTVGHIALHRFATDSVQQASLRWRSVVVVGAGEAGSGYFALDVTAPEDPQLLWEITPDRHCWGPNVSVAGVAGPTCGAPLANTVQDMGRSIGKPYMTSLFYQRGAELPAQHAVAIIPLGMPPAQATVANLGVEGAGQRGVMVVELETGTVVRKFLTANFDLYNMQVAVPVPATDLGYFWIDPACYNAAAGQIATRCFIGDSKGMLWRMDLADSNPINWKLSFFHDAYGGPSAPVTVVQTINSINRTPILSPPSLATVSPNAQSALRGDLAVIYGTGSGSTASSALKQQVVYSLFENFQVVGGVQRAVAVRNWVKRLSALERFIGPPVVFAFNAYWATFQVSAAGSCEVGTARLWGARYEKPQFVSDPEDLQGVFPNPLSPGNTATNLDYLDIGAFKPSPVDVQAMPACRGNCNPIDFTCVSKLPPNSSPAVGGTKPRYEVGVATGDAQTQSKNQSPMAGNKPSVGTAALELPPPRTAAVVTGWDLLID